MDPVLIPTIRVRLKAAEGAECVINADDFDAELHEALGDAPVTDAPQVTDAPVTDAPAVETLQAPRVKGGK